MKEKVVDYFTSPVYLRHLALMGAASTVALAISGIVLSYFQGRQAGVENDSWFRATSESPATLPPVPKSTWSRQQLMDEIQLHICRVEGEGRGASGVYGVVYAPSWVLFPTHCFGENGLATITYRGLSSKIHRDSSEHKIRRGSSEHKLLLNPELSLHYVAGLTGVNGVRKYFVPHTTNAKAMHCGFLVNQNILDVGTVKSRVS